MCTCCQGNSSAAKARNISHGVRPPLTAMMKRPRAAAAARGTGNDRRRLAGDHVVIGMNFDPHATTSGFAGRPDACLPLARGFLHVAAEFVAHGGEQLVAKSGFAAR